jgi:hypothetical protein
MHLEKASSPIHIASTGPLAGSNKVDYPFDVSTETAYLTTADLLINGVIFTPKAKFMATNIKTLISARP